MGPQWHLVHISLGWCWCSSFPRDCCHRSHLGSNWKLSSKRHYQEFFAALYYIPQGAGEHYLQVLWVACIRKMKPLKSHKLFNFSCCNTLEMLFVPGACTSYHNSKTQLFLFKSLPHVSGSLLSFIWKHPHCGLLWLRMILLKQHNWPWLRRTCTEKTTCLLFSLSSSLFCTLSFLILP